MIKIVSIFIGLVIFTSSFVGAAAYQYDPRDSEISRLTAEKQRKYAELEKCAKSVKGLQIAGISTIGLTAGGVALNISQANKSKTLDNQIIATNSKIEKKKQEIEQKRIQEEKERAEKEAQTKAKTECETDSTKIYINSRCVDRTSVQTQQNTPVEQTDSTTTTNNTQSVATADNTIDTNQEIETEDACKYFANLKSGTECYQDSRGKWKIRWTVKEGDSCPINECFDTTNTATCKYVWVPSSFVCVADTCKTGYKIFGHMCQKETPITCDETNGEIVASSGDKCLKCATGRIAKNGRCEECPVDKKPAGNKCEDYTCGPSEFKSWGKCVKCAENFIVDNNHCVECPSTKKAENNRCVDFNCPSNMFKSSGKCVACDTLFENMVPKADQSGCEQRYTTDAMDEFKSGCRAIGGRLDGPNKCFLPNCNIEYREIEKQCRDVSANSGLPVYIGRESGSCYCTI